MQDYQIRLLREDGTVSLTTAQRHISSEAAITAAKKLAHGTRYEVWDGERCVYEWRDPTPRPSASTPGPAS